MVILILYLRKSKSSKTSSLTDSRRNFPWIYGVTLGSPTLMPSPGSGGAKEGSPLKELDPGLQWAQNKLSKSSGAYASWEVRQCSDMILGNSTNVLNFESAQRTQATITCTDRETPTLLLGNNFHWLQKGSSWRELWGFPMEGQLHHLGILAWKVKSFVSPGQMQPSGKLPGCCDTSACSCLRWHSDFHTRKLHKLRLFSLICRCLCLSAPREHLLAKSSWFQAEIGDCTQPSSSLLHPSHEKFYQPQ